MKLLYHATCGDIRAPDRDGAWTYCRCGAAAMRWVDPHRGIAQVTAPTPFYRPHVRILGIDNSFLAAGIDGVETDDARGQRPLNSIEWRELHAAETKAAKGYLFHEDQRACVFVVIAPGESVDTSWAPWPGAAA